MFILTVMSAFLMAAARHCAEQDDIMSASILLGFGWAFFIGALATGESETKK